MSQDHNEQAIDVFRALQGLARAEYGGNTQALLTVYASEGFLRRLSVSDYAARMTLKGGMLMAAGSARRMTRDADLSTRGISNDEDALADVVREIAATMLDIDDGLVFDTGTITTERMRQDAEYHGIRVKLIAKLATAKLTTTLDFSFGESHERSSWTCRAFSAAAQSGCTAIRCSSRWQRRSPR